MRRTALTTSWPLIMAAILATASVLDAKAAAPAPRILKAKGLGTANFLRFSPDGRFLASCHFPGVLAGGAAAGQVAAQGGAGAMAPSVAVWSVAKSRLLWHEAEPCLGLKGFGSGNTHNFDFSPDNSLLAVPASPTGAMFDWIGLRNAATGRLQRTCKFQKRSAATSPVAFSPDGRLLAFSQLPDSIQLWNPKSATQLAVLRQPYPSIVLDMAFSPDSRILVTCGLGMNVQVLNDAPRVQESVNSAAALREAASRGAKPPRNAKVHSGQGMGVPPTPRGFTGKGTGQFVLDFWNMSNRELIHSRKTDERVTQTAFSPDGKLLAFGGGAETLVLEVATGKVRHAIKGCSQTLAFSDDGKSMTAVWNSGNQFKVSVIDLANDRSETTVEKSIDEATTLQPVLSADGRLLAVVVEASPPAVLIYDTRSGRQRAACHPAVKSQQPHYFTMGVTGVISPDNGTLAVARMDGAIELWPISEAPNDKL